MKTLKNIILSTAAVAGLAFGANAQKTDDRMSVPDTTKIITVSEPDTTILQPYFLIKDLTMNEKTFDKSYRIDMTKSKVHPDHENEFTTYASFKVFEYDFDKKFLKSPQIPGQTLDDKVFDELNLNSKLYKMGESYVPGKCPNDCNVDPLEVDFRNYLSVILGKYSSVCTDLTTKELTSLNGIITADESHVLNEKARKLLLNHPGKYGIAIGVSQSNIGHSYNVKDVNGKVTKGYKGPENKGLVMVVMPPIGTVGPKGSDYFKESEFIIEDDFKKEIVPCDGPECDDNGKPLKKSKTKNESNGFYISPSVGKNNTLDLVVPNLALGLTSGNVSFGFNGGYATGNSNKNTFFQGVNGGYTNIDSTRNTELKQFGIEASVALFDGRLKPFLGFQKNVVSQETGGVVEQFVVDGNGNGAYNRSNLQSSKDTYEYETLNPGLGFKITKNIDAIVQAKYNTRAKEFQEYNAGLRFNIGKR